MKQLLFLILLTYPYFSYCQSKKLSAKDEKALQTLRTKLKSHNLTLCGFVNDIGSIEAKNRRKSEQTYPNDIVKRFDYAEALNKKDKNSYFKKTGMSQSDATLAAVFVYFSKVETCD